MAEDQHIQRIADALRDSIGLFVRRLRQVRVDGELSLPERSALSRLDRGGPATSAALARLEQISPQSMGATLGSLESQGLIERRPDPLDGRRVVLSINAAGSKVLRDRRHHRTEQLTQALSTGFTAAEIQQLAAVVPLIERLAATIR